MSGYANGFFPAQIAEDALSVVQVCYGFIRSLAERVHTSVVHLLESGYKEVTVYNALKIDPSEPRFKFAAPECYARDMTGNETFFQCLATRWFFSFLFLMSLMLRERSLRRDVNDPAKTHQA